VTASLGIDVGLSGVRASVMRDDGRVLATARCVSSPTFAEGLAEQDPRGWLADAIEAGSRAVADAATVVDGVAVAALGPAPVLLDANGEPLSSTPLFGLDRRAAPWRERLATGPDHALPTLLRWADTAPELIAKASTVVDAAGFVVRAMTGENTMDRITAVNYRWPGIATPVPLPTPDEPEAVAGTLAPSAADALGLRTGTPVAVGTIDCFADVAAAGVTRSGDGAILLGSTLVLYAVADGAPEVLGLDTTPHLGDGSLVGGSTATAGLALERFVRILGSTEDLQREADSLDPGSGGLLALPYLAGERTPVRDPLARGVLAGLTLTTTATHVYRAMVDGIALTALDHHDRLQRWGLAPERYRVAGGGALNGTWLTSVCDAVGAPFDVMPDAGSAAGAAWLGLRMLGSEPDRKPVQVREPDESRHARFQDLLERARELWRAAGPVVRRLGDVGSDAARGEYA
jgi:xylulokinase